MLNAVAERPQTAEEIKLMLRAAELAHHGDITAACKLLEQWAQVNMPDTPDPGRKREMSRPMRERPFDRRDLNLAELGLDDASISTIERAFHRMYSRLRRDAETVTAGELTKWSAEDLREMGIDGITVRNACRALVAVRLRLRGG